MATDGNLARDGRHLTFVSKDRELVETLLECVSRPDARIVQVRTSSGGSAFRAQLSDVRLHQWLAARGLRPAKSLTLGAVEVPDDLFIHLLRGLLDGDGSIYVRRQRPTKRMYPDYWYMRIWTYFTSASLTHVEWLGDTIATRLGPRGWLEQMHRPNRHPFYRLRFGKADSLALLGALYADPTWPALARKRDIWHRYVNEGRCAEGGI